MFLTWFQGTSLIHRQTHQYTVSLSKYFKKQWSRTHTPLTSGIDKRNYMLREKRGIPNPVSSWTSRVPAVQTLQQRKGFTALSVAHKISPANASHADLFFSLSQAPIWNPSGGKPVPRGHLQKTSGRKGVQHPVFLHANSFQQVSALFPYLRTHKHKRGYCV